jgi:hypothetical protein
MFFVIVYMYKIFTNTVLDGFFFGGNNKFPVSYGSLLAIDDNF